MEDKEVVPIPGGGGGGGLGSPGGGLGSPGGRSTGGGRGRKGGIVRRASLGSQPVTERWVCPNDRHLALRAKLKMGWSTSQPVPVARQDSLSEAETKIILGVIQRAEQLELVEQQRIGRLVDKVEVMKGRAQGNGSKNCILCGESLSVLRTSTLICADCKKRVCSKCGIDTQSPTGERLWLCKICAETREMWKRSGAWFFRGVPKHILPVSSSSSASSSASSSSSFFSSSSAPTSTKRSRPPPPRRAHTLGFKASSAGVGVEGEVEASSEDETQRRLRKTASECVPSDTDHLPSQHPPARSRSVSPSPYPRDSQDPAKDSSDEHPSDRSPLSPAGPQRDLSRTTSRESQGGGGAGGEGVGGLLLSPYYSPSGPPHQLSPSRSELRRDQAIDRSPSPLLRVAWRESGRGSNSSVSDSPNLSREDGEGAGGGEGGSGSGPDTPNMVPPPPNTPRSPLPINRSSSSSSGSIVGGVGGSVSSPTVNGVRSRRGSEASRGSDERRHPRLARSTGDSKDSRDSRDSLVSRGSSTTTTREEAATTTSSSVDDVFLEPRQPLGPPEMGSVEFSLLYDSHNQALHCTVHCARNLRPAESSRLADPYVKLHLLPGASKSNKLRTRTISKTIQPDFHETLTYYGISEQDMARKTLRLTILDEDRFGHDFLGEARMALRQVTAHETKRLKITLEKRLSLAEDEVKGEAERGKVLLSLKYSSQRNSLIVGIVRCAHLPSMDSNGFSDPYVKVQLKPDPSYKKYRTAIKWKNLNPEFNEEFLFELRRNELPKKLLDIRVYDKDVGRSDDFIGGLQLSQDSTGTELRHWYDALQYPDRRHDRWHQLQPLNAK